MDQSENPKPITANPYKKGEDLIRAGDLQAAEEIYMQIIRSPGSNHIAYGNLAAIYGMQGRLTEASDCLAEALRIKPDYPEALCNMGYVLHRLGRLDEAISYFKAALKSNSNSAEAYNNLGNALKDRGDFEDAAQALETALELKTDYPEARNNLGLVLYGMGRLEEALSCYFQAIKLKPGYPEAYNNLGIALHHTQEFDAAIEAYNTALKNKPDFTDAYNNLGITYKEKGDFSAAVKSFKSALRLHRDHREALNNLANTFRIDGRPNAAITLYRRCIELYENYVDPHNGLGIAMLEMGNIALAVSSFERALQHSPDYPEAHNNLGIALQQLGHLDRAIESYSKAVQLRPSYPEANANLGMLLLLVGDYKRGWDKYDARLDSKDISRMLYCRPKTERWHADLAAPDRRVLVVSEQGLGDTLQFMRYLIPLAERGFDVLFASDEKLHGIIRESGVCEALLNPAEIVGINDRPWIPLMSLPGLLGVTPENPVVVKPYLKTNSELTSKWRGKIQANNRPVIAINWQGNPEHEKSTSRGRSLPLESFAPIVRDSSVSLLSLQKGFGSEQMNDCSFRERFVDCQDEISSAWDFLETASIIENCDLVITSDTSVAHLAGAMGQQTWVLLQAVPEWRWGLEGDSTFWYPSVRLFRQRDFGDWAEVMERVAAELHHLLEGMSPSPVAAESSRLPAKTSLPIQAPVALGELIDRITILQLKRDSLHGVFRESVEAELMALEAVFDGLDLALDASWIRRLKNINLDLLRLQDCLRGHESEKDFGDLFIENARSFHRKNDQRAALKQHIDAFYASIIAAGDL